MKRFRSWGRNELAWVERIICIIGVKPERQGLRADDALDDYSTQDDVTVIPGTRPGEGDAVE